MTEIEILEIRVLPGNKSTRAFCDIRIGDITIRDFRICQGNGRPYVKMPFSTYRNQSGELCFRQIINLPEEVQGRVDNMILTAFYREKEKMDGTSKR